MQAEVSIFDLDGGEVTATGPLRIELGDKPHIITLFIGAPGSVRAAILIEPRAQLSYSWPPAPLGTDGRHIAHLETFRKVPSASKCCARVVSGK